jgi:prevent-host-death family protein
MAEEQVPKELHLGVSETKQQFSKLANDVASGDSRVIVEKHGLKIAVMIDYADYKRFIAFEAWERERDAMLRQISDRFADVSDEEHEAQVHKAVAEARAEYRAKQQVVR